MGYSGCDNNLGNLGDYNIHCNNNSFTFVLIVVLFILLIIVGATFMHNKSKC